MCKCHRGGQTVKGVEFPARCINLKDTIQIAGVDRSRIVVSIDYETRSFFAPPLDSEGYDEGGQNVFHLDTTRIYFI